ncbi:hypothetical protein [Rhodococcus qingshengii]|uniref:hypothetical protein n=1 Tax=Rhodococcus qingshengii TaxID=334542 RepID=UPI000A3EB322|nr:hypothetical protein [Rhodococcus qingshengii]
MAVSVVVSAQGADVVVDVVVGTVVGDVERPVVGVHSFGVSSSGERFTVLVGADVGVMEGWFGAGWARAVPAPVAQSSVVKDSVANDRAPRGLRLRRGGAKSLENLTRYPSFLEVAVDTALRSLKENLIFHKRNMHHFGNETNDLRVTQSFDRLTARFLEFS